MRSPKAITLKRARSLRRTLSTPEARLWVRLRNRGEDHPAFRRQHPFGPYILDFYCPQLKLAIEVDGQGHTMGDQPRHDIQRDAWLRTKGVEVVRLEAVEVLKDPDAAADAIWNLVLSRTRGVWA
ncbi:endonuclease domain-containing protein [Caulobacter sp. 17J80-11]|uniref:endonuclease domain-containing protein n=1 Tax=Caulobacter sp. 17J80-11 TaxID=2763502 RepID=UPI0016538169|nr:endonuclease domain-containing protein [Caulobacter sp. 17J80-11]MBC6980942.1 DUF559 domain-containing protein [Caulobacter sp. 17J80-11]